MNKRNSVALAATIGFAVAVLPFSVSAEDELVQGYVKDSSGQVYKNSYGECWRTAYKDTTEKLEECGYKKIEPVVEAPAPAPAPTPIIETVYEAIVINAAFLFGFDSAELTDDAKAVIEERVEKFNGNAELTQNVSVIGHTDSTGPEAYNQKLSERRAQSVADYLEENKNISDDRIDVEGRGESEPAASNATREGRAQNRRVVIHVEGKIQK
jgi:OmpA-OmpF porin, OOP family